MKLQNVEEHLQTHNVEMSELWNSESELKKVKYSDLKKVQSSTTGLIFEIKKIKIYYVYLILDYWFFKLWKPMNAWKDHHT